MQAGRRSRSRPTRSCTRSCAASTRFRGLATPAGLEGRRQGCPQPLGPVGRELVQLNRRSTLSRTAEEGGDGADLPPLPDRLVVSCSSRQSGSWPSATTHSSRLRRRLLTPPPRRRAPPRSRPPAPGGSRSGQVYHGSAPGVEGLTKAIAKAHGAVSTSEGNARQLEEKSAQATSTTPAESGRRHRSDRGLLQHAPPSHHDRDPPRTPATATHAGTPPRTRRLREARRPTLTRQGDARARRPGARPPSKSAPTTSAPATSAPPRSARRRSGARRRARSRWCCSGTRPAPTTAPCTASVPAPSAAAARASPCSKAAPRSRLVRRDHARGAGLRHADDPDRRPNGRRLR